VGEDRGEGGQDLDIHPHPYPPPSKGEGRNSQFSSFVGDEPVMKDCLEARGALGGFSQGSFSMQSDQGVEYPVVLEVSEAISTNRHCVRSVQGRQYIG
jgi:hypothetical protein